MLLIERWFNWPIRFKTQRRARLVKQFGTHSNNINLVKFYVYNFKLDCEQLRRKCSFKTFSFSKSNQFNFNYHNFFKSNFKIIKMTELNWGEGAPFSRLAILAGCGLDSNNVSLNYYTVIFEKKNDLALSNYLMILPLSLIVGT